MVNLPSSFTLCSEFILLVRGFGNFMKLVLFRSTGILFGTVNAPAFFARIYTQLNWQTKSTSLGALKI